MQFVTREKYLDFLHSWKDHEIIKVISGVRRSGKSTLLRLFKNELLENGVGEDQIHSINFENRKFREIETYKQLEDYLFERFVENKMNYVFLDEIQNIKSFEKAVNALFVENNVDVYITGSNAYFMSGELATLLSGRYVELPILPLSFKEFVAWHKQYNDVSAGWSLPMFYNEYIKSSFPYTIILQSKDERDTYLDGLVSTVLIKDVVERNKITDVGALERITDFLFNVIGSSISINKVRNTLKSNGLPLSAVTVDKYINSLEKALLFYSARRFNIRGKRLLEREEKFYTVDVGLRNLRLPDSPEDAGHVLENIVYLELLRRFKNVYVGKIDEFEVDFVAVNTKQEIQYFQVALTTLDKNILARELRSLRKIPDAYPRSLLTLDEINRTANYNGIQKINVLDWLLQDSTKDY
ncbi:MAG: ATP-binding protein [Lactobacillales bacterium]|jgi:predicted AAA+ superfamily ATPase|nr:ATP-binding protein [Lactobacillales bacterium]